MKVKTIRLYKDNEEIIVEEKRIREFSDLGYRAKPLGAEDTKSGDSGKGKGRKAKDEAVQDADEAGGAR